MFCGWGGWGGFRVSDDLGWFMQLRIRSRRGIEDDLPVGSCLGFMSHSLVSNSAGT